jgi:ribosomal protein S17E
MTRSESKKIRNMLRGWAARLETTKTQNPEHLIRDIAREMKEIADEMETTERQHGN